MNDEGPYTKLGKRSEWKACGDETESPGADREAGHRAPGAASL
jgi:hypothetical protein